MPITQKEKRIFSFFSVFLPIGFSLPSSASYILRTKYGQGLSAFLRFAKPLYRIYFANAIDSKKITFPSKTVAVSLPFKEKTGQQATFSQQSAKKSNLPLVKSATLAYTFPILSNGKRGNDYGTDLCTRTV